MRTRSQIVFRESTEDVLNWLKLIERVDRVSRAKFPVGVGIIKEISDLKDALHSYSPTARVVPMHGAFLFVCAEFEFAVRSLVEAYAKSVHRKVSRYSLLEARVRKNHLRFSATILSELHLQKYGTLDEFDIVSKLFGCFDPSSEDHGYELFEQAFSYTNSNMKWSEINVLLKRCGVDDVLTAVCSRRRLQEVLGVPDAQRASAHLPTQLDRFMEMRNSIIHRTGLVLSPTASDVRRQILLKREIVMGLKIALERKYRML